MAEYKTIVLLKRIFRISARDSDGGEVGIYFFFLVYPPFMKVAIHRDEDANRKPMIKEVRPSISFLFIGYRREIVTPGIYVLDPEESLGFIIKEKNGDRIALRKVP